MAIWKSATLGSAPPIAPARSSPSTWSSSPGRLARSAAHVLVVAWLARAAALITGAPMRAATATGTPSLAPSR